MKGARSEEREARRARVPARRSTEAPRRQRRASPRALQAPFIWHGLVWVGIGFFVLNVLALIAAVVVDSFATRWLGTWLPSAYTLRWYGSAWSEFQLDSVLLVTVEVVLVVIVISLLVGVPAAYALARRSFRFKRVVLLLFVLPLLVPPMTYGIPLATVLYSLRLAGTINGVILANLVPAVPFVILVMTPFVEQIDPRLEAAARVLGAGTLRIFLHILVPLLAPGILAAGLLVLVRTIGMFELTFLTSGSDSQTLVVALYYTVFAAGVRAGQSINAMAVIYMVTALIPLVIALRFVDPTQLVTRVKSER